jgi:hypothetical protein
MNSATFEIEQLLQDPRRQRVGERGRRQAGSGADRVDRRSQLREVYRFDDRRVRNNRIIGKWGCGCQIPLALRLTCDVEVAAATKFTGAMLIVVGSFAVSFAVSNLVPETVTVLVTVAGASTATRHTFTSFGPPTGRALMLGFPKSKRYAGFAAVSLIELIPAHPRLSGIVARCP